MGLIRLGYEEHADALRDRVAGTVSKEGLREYYDPYDGHGMGESAFAWASLVMELIEPDALAASSFLGA